MFFEDAFFVFFFPPFFLLFLIFTFLSPSLYSYLAGRITPESSKNEKLRVERVADCGLDGEREVREVLVNKKTILVGRSSNIDES